jgi:hypothetical protein
MNTLFVVCIVLVGTAAALTSVKRTKDKALVLAGVVFLVALWLLTTRTDVL